MKKTLLGVIVFVCFLASTALSQQSSASPNEPSIILDIKIIDVSTQTIEEIDRLSQDKNRVSQLVTEGKIKLTASVQMKTVSGEENNLRTSQRVPLPKGDMANAQVQYENVGFTIEIEPKLTKDNLIETRLKIDMAGIVSGKNPTYIQRSMNQKVRLKPGEATLLMGLTQNGNLWANSDNATQGNFFVLVTARLTN